MSQTSLDDRFLQHHLPGESPAVLELRERIGRLNLERNRGLVSTILLRGASGAGKTFAAKVIAAHRIWKRIQNTREAGDPSDFNLDQVEGYTAVHLPAVPDALIESELFGSKKGSFTDASHDRPGLLGDDKLTDVLLDEIGDASLPLQAKLLSVVDTRHFRPVGGDADDEKRTSARLILATNKPLEALIKAGKFREDLYWRVQPQTIELPPLRSQAENIAALARKIEGTILKDLPGHFAGVTFLQRVDFEFATRHIWRGNVRQLANAVRTVVLEERARSLEAVCQEMDRTAARLEEAHSSGVGDAVRERLDAALKGEGPPFKILEDLITETSREVRRAALDWIDTRKPNTTQLQKMFPAMKRTSIQSAISRWRGQS